MKHRKLLSFRLCFCLSDEDEGESLVMTMSMTMSMYTIVFFFALIEKLQQQKMDARTMESFFADYSHFITSLLWK
jgi:hypothetical protein